MKASAFFAMRVNGMDDAQNNRCSLKLSATEKEISNNGAQWEKCLALLPVFY